LQATGARRASAGSPDAAEIVRRLRAVNASGEGFVALFDARAIAGERHLLSAWAHLGRARRREQARLRDRGAEFALFVAGDDQLPRALTKVGVGPSTETFVLVAERPRELPALLQHFDLAADPAVYPKAPGAETLERLGIGEAERSVVPEAAWEGLVLERVAFVDLAAGRSADGAPGPKGGRPPGSPSPAESHRKRE
jgi:tRNA threonylcarbamoyladenosine modification (KEOPS) complex Cgi121 subunit